QMSALLLGRTYDRLTGLSVAAMLLLLEQPLYVFYSGFLLSFGAVLGVTVIAPMVEKLCKDKGTIVKWFGKLFSGGIGILAATFPIQLYFYYEYPIYSMLINIMVLPFLPYIVGFGAIVLAIPGGFGVVALPFVYVCQVLLWGYEQICLQSQKLPYHCLVLGAPAGWQIVLYYVCLIAGGYLLLHRKRKWVPALVSMAMMVAVFVLTFRPVCGLTCRFLSVGQGDCTVLQYGQETYVVDCGSTSESKVADNILLPCLKYYGISEVDGVFISHADGDHMNGILQWLTTYEHSHVKIGRIVLPSLGKEALEQEFGELLRSAETLDIPVTTLGAGDSLQMGELELEVLHPVKHCVDVEDANGYSQVLLFTYQRHGILLTGDIGAEQEATLLEKLSEVQEKTQHNAQNSLKDESLNMLNTGRNISVLKAAHHGSKYSNSSEFLQSIKPQHVVLSYGIGNSYGHPHADAVARMNEINAELWYTGRQGAIMVEMYGKIEVRSWHAPTEGGR
ncbi:MAG: ComEC/Rec2 family competence protein, partial [Lachnospiraceae bacterium]|nr:ComEC/Rec2 family competence protein [Lachnospiraceae bacterium]